MNKRWFLLALFVAIFSWTTTAQLLWKISGNDLTRPSYLFGTHHAISKEQIRQFDRYLSICGQTNAVVGEIDLADSAIQQKIMRESRMTGCSLKELMSPGDYELVDTEFKQVFGYGLDPFANIKPMMLISMYSVMSYMKAVGLTEQPVSLDELFQKEAHEKGLKVIGLETADYQVNLLFNSIPLKRQADLLVECIKDKQKDIESNRLLNEAYIAGDLTKVASFEENDDWLPEEREQLIDKRNLFWATQLPSLMKEKSCFIAVGCMHLVGETGLIKQLTKAGYTVKAVTF
ncbi:MAG: TraB/GumN family protein [Bacteroidota bacterium]|nr:TraB/GumN family protein [Bacteroidota bacterium]